MTLQEAFDKSVAGLASQQFLPAKDDILCMYRDSKGRKCAVGHLIPDDKYRPDFEGSTLKANSLREEMLAACGLENTPEVIDFCTDLQWAHDQSGTPQDMKEALLKTGQKYGLRIPRELE